MFTNLRQTGYWAPQKQYRKGKENNKGEKNNQRVKQVGESVYVYRIIFLFIFENSPKDGLIQGDQSQEFYYYFILSK
jgi:hypothetical protein